MQNSIYDDICRQTIPIAVIIISPTNHSTRPAGRSVRVVVRFSNIDRCAKYYKYMLFCLKRLVWYCLMGLASSLGVHTDARTHGSICLFELWRVHFVVLSFEKKLGSCVSVDPSPMKIINWWSLDYRDTFERINYLLLRTYIYYLSLCQHMLSGFILRSKNYRLYIYLQKFPRTKCVILT